MLIAAGIVTILGAIIFVIVVVSNSIGNKNNIESDFKLAKNIGNALIERN